MDNFDKEAEVVALSLRSKVDALEVVDQGSYDLANAINKQAYEGRKAFHTWFDPIDEASKRQRQATIAQGKKIDDPFDYVIKVTGSKAATWMRAEKAKADEVRRIAEEAARREAEEAQIRAAESLQAEGLSAAAEAVLDAPVVTPKVEVAMPEKSDGVSYRDVWSAEVTCLSELVKAVAAGTAPLNAIQANESYLGQWARMSKGTESLPGVKVQNTPIQTRRV